MLPEPTSVTSVSPGAVFRLPDVLVMLLLSNDLESVVKS